MDMTHDFGKSHHSTLWKAIMQAQWYISNTHEHVSMMAQIYDTTFFKKKVKWGWVWAWGQSKARQGPWFICMDVWKSNIINLNIINQHCVLIFFVSVHLLHTWSYLLHMARKVKSSRLCRVYLHLWFLEESSHNHTSLLSCHLKQWW